MVQFKIEGDFLSQTVVGVMKAHAHVLSMQVSAALFLRKCTLVAGTHAVVVAAGGIEALVRSVREHVHWKLDPTVWHTLGILLSSPSGDTRAERVERVLAAGGLEAVLSVMARSGSGPGRHKRLTVPLHTALVVLPKLCASDANYRQLVSLDGVEAVAQKVALYKDEADAVACMNVLQRVYCRVSAECGGLTFGNIEAVVKAMERHGESGVLQQPACAGVGMYFRCERASGGGTIGGVGLQGVEWCLRGVLASMQRNKDLPLVQEVGFKSVLRFMALRESHKELEDGIVEAYAGGAGDLALGAVKHHGPSEEHTRMRANAFAVLEVLCHLRAHKTPIALDGGVEPALASLRSGECGAAEAGDALDFLSSLACGHEKATAEIVLRGGIGTVLGRLVEDAVLAEGAVVAGGARALAGKAIEVLVMGSTRRSDCDCLQGFLTNDLGTESV
jgi:hypothetical protein